MTQRTAKFERRSRETEIRSEINVDGQGQSKIQTPIGLLDHMLDLFAFHGCFDLELIVEKADTEIDHHHCNEDIGIVLGKLFDKALEERQGITRFGSAKVPMESTLGESIVDISGRGYLHWELIGATPEPGEDQYSIVYLEHFLESFAHKLGATIHVRVWNPEDSTADVHTVTETVFKSLGRALDQATRFDPRRKGQVPSTKGIID